ncbi:Ig-like domain-containing protein [Patescibacteria group bacterium]
MIQTEVATQVTTRTKITLGIGMTQAFFLGAAMLFQMFSQQQYSIITTYKTVDVIAPYIELTSHQDADELSGDVLIEAFAYDETNTAEVHFSINGFLQFVDKDASDGWSMMWDTRMVTNGSYLIDVTAHDSGGNIGFTQPITVSLIN